jgi:hypothetical protein
MRSLIALFAAILVSSALGKEGYVETLVFPPEFEELAKAHHCNPVHHALESDDPSETMPFDLRDIPPKRVIVGWCMKNSATPKSTPTYILMIGAPSPDNPLHYCPDEIHGITRIGSPSIDALPMIPHDFVFFGDERASDCEGEPRYDWRPNSHAGTEGVLCLHGRTMGSLCTGTLVVSHAPTTADKI